MTDGICEGTTLGIEGTMLGIHEGIELGEIDLMTLGFILKLISLFPIFIVIAYFTYFFG